MDFWIKEPLFPGCSYFMQVGAHAQANLEHSFQVSLGDGRFRDPTKTLANLADHVSLGGK